jgi:16S rRNA (cytosine1402-N4)-methyltransferase
MLGEVLEILAGVPSGVLVDATVGAAGHAAALLESHPGWELVGVDRDPDAVEAARDRLAPFGARASLHRARFDELPAILAGSGQGGRGVVAVLFDLGVSSHQLDTPRRGFSYREEGPLDMRMDPGSGPSAADIVNAEDEASLAELFARHGEERFARRIARAVVAGRPYRSTVQLADVVASALPAAARRRGHPARRVFQALRARVNEELELLGPALDWAVDALVPGGRAVVLAYHSGEDRIVKERFRAAVTGGCTCPEGLPCVCGATPRATWVTRGARRPSAEEVARNPRAKSARLRALEKLGAAANRPRPPA